MSKKAKIICYCLSSLVLLIPIIWSIFSWRINGYYVLAYKEPTLTSIEYKIERPSDISYESLKESVDDLLDYNGYNFKFGYLYGDVYGKCNIFSKDIIIKNNISYEFFVFSLTHEIIHLKYFTLNERFVNYNAFKVLYESNNEYFKNVALYFANRDLNGDFTREYSFVGYI